MGRFSFLWRNAAWRDALIVGIIFIAAFSISVAFEAFEWVIKFSLTHEDWEVDELLTVMMMMPVALGIYAGRRLTEARTELKRREAAEREASKMALHDPLTGLPNRRKATLEIERALTHAKERPVTLLAIDLNRFKPINDLHGHAAGDQLLLVIGKALSRSAEPGTLVARLGGDEFCMMLTGRMSDEEKISQLETLSSQFERPIQLDAGSVTVGASIGVATTDDPHMDQDELMAQADAAMYRCKAGGRNGYSFFEPGMEKVVQHRARVEADLRDAVANGHIQPHFQPLVNLKSGDLLGYEVLARWKMPDGSIRMPGEFIAIAEETGLISDVFFSILVQAAERARDWPENLYFAVNLSPVQFNDQWLVERILKTLLEAHVHPGRLEVEITESALVTDLEVARYVIKSLKNQGIRVSLDDFGTGYSSLRHLSELPFDKLKIDRSFIHDIDRNDASQNIVRAVTALAHNLGLEVTAEGIETKDNASSIQKYGCDIGQGYLYGLPSANTLSRGSGIGRKGDKKELGDDVTPTREHPEPVNRVA